MSEKQISGGTQKTGFSQKEINEWNHCDQIIKKGLMQWYAVGEAIARVSEKKLYLVGGFKTFEECCRQQWKISRQHANRLLMAFRLNGELSPMGDVIFDTERQSRRIRQLDVEAKKEIYSQIAMGIRGKKLNRLIALAEKRKPSHYVLRAENYLEGLCKVLPLLPDPYPFILKIEAEIKKIKETELKEAA